MKKYLLTTFFIVTALILSSCSKDQKNGGKISYRIKPANYTAALAASAPTSGITIKTGSAVTWTSGTLNVSEIDFEAEKDDVETEYQLKNHVSVDLFNLSPVLGSISIPDGTYNEVELKIVLKKTGTGNVPLALKGEYTDGSGVKTPVEFSFNEDVEIEVEAENVVVSSNDYIGMINFQLNKFLANVTTSDLSNSMKTGGKIVISSTSNTELYHKIKANFRLVADCDFDD